MKWLITFLLITTISIISSAATCESGNCQDGYGILITQSGSKYLGEFKNGKKNGQGVFHYSDNIKYVGSWRNDLRHGLGNVYINGKVAQTGTWENDKITEQSKVIYGCVSGNCTNGFGIYVHKSGEKIYAQFSKGKIINNVVCYYANGEKYIGSWYNNHRDGLGTLYQRDGKVSDGIWGKDLFIGATKNEALIGCVSGNCGNGDGVYIYEDKTRYNGEFKNGLAVGFGICYYADGDISVGNWKNHAFDGQGTMYYNDGSTLEGNWKNGQFVQVTTEPEPEVFFDYDDKITTTNANTVRNSQGKIWVILVGVGRYTSMPTLKYTDDDAYKLYGFFKSPEGGAIPDGQIMTLIDEDASRAKVLKSVRDFSTKAAPQDVVLFYFSGHGKKGAFLPSDYDGSSNVIEHSTLLKEMENSQAKSKIIIADACHSGSFTTSKGEDYQAMVNNYYQAFAQSSGGTVLMMSSKSNEISIESSGLRQGIFSYYLINGLKGNANTNSDGIVTIQEAFDYIYANVRHFSGNSQSPVIHGNFDKNMPLGGIR
jgi:hypothetical protein